MRIARPTSGESIRGVWDMAFGRESTVITVDLYLRYLTGCRTLAIEYKVTLRDLDRALWEWSMAPCAAARPLRPQQIWSQNWQIW